MRYTPTSYSDVCFLNGVGYLVLIITWVCTSSLVGWMFTNGPGNLGSIRGCVFKNGTWYLIA